MLLLASMFARASEAPCWVLTLAMAAEDVDLFRLKLPSWLSCAGERAGKGAGKSLKIWKPWKCDGVSHKNHAQHVFWRFLVLSGLTLRKIEGEPLDSFAEEYCSPVKLVHLPSGDSLWHTIFATDRFQQCPKRWMPHSWKVWRSSKREQRETPP